MPTQGPLSAGTGVDDSSVGTVAWSNPSRVVASDNSASGAAVNSATSHYLKATDFGFSIPAGATIDGITVFIERRRSIAGTTVKDSRVRIVKGGAVGATDKADTVTDWPTSDTVKTYGSSSDLWGESWSAADINGATFGVVLSAVGTGDPDTAVVDHISITVDYTEITNHPFSASGASTSSGSVTFLLSSRFSASGASTSSGSLTLEVRPPRFTASGSSVSSGSVVFRLIRTATFAGGSVSSGTLVLATVYEYITPIEVPSPMSASIRQTTPTTPDSRSELIRLDGTGAAVVRALVDVDHGVPIGVGAQVIKAHLLLYKAETWAAGTHTLSVDPVDEAWDAEAVTWDTQPDIRAGGTTEVIPAGGAVGDLIEIEVTSLIQASVAAEDAAGTQSFGLRLSLDTAGEKRFYSAFATPDYRPKLRIEHSLPPAAPEDLLPSAGNSVSEVKPELVARFFDPDAEDVLSAIRVQIDDANTFDEEGAAALVYDSDWVSHNQPRFDLDVPPAGAPATPSLSVATPYWWRMYVRDNHGVESPASESAEFLVTAKGSLSLDTPSGSTVSSPTPLISWTFTGTQEQVEVEVERYVSGSWETHWLLSKHVSSVTSVSLPDADRLVEGESYRISLRIWDDVVRADMAHDRAFVEEQREITLTGVSV